MHPLTHKVLENVRQDELLCAGDRVGVAVSGGIDSVALLRILLELRTELGIVLSVVHVNHKLRAAESDADEAFVASLAREHDLAIHVIRADVARHASERHISLETAARETRYKYFAELLRADNLDKIATGHTLDDQAETVLMRVIRGTGMRGLGAIHPHLQLEDQPGEIVRPLLATRRCALEQQLRDLGQFWREDSSNQDPAFTRNRVRHRLMPLLEHEFNPSIAERLSELAQIARAEEDYWDSEAEGWMGTAVQWFDARQASPASSSLVQIKGLPSAGKTSDPQMEGPGGSRDDVPHSAALNLHWLLSEPLALQRRVIKSIAEETGFPIEFRHVEEVLRFAAHSAAHGKEISLPRGWKAFREEDLLIFQAPEPGEPKQADFEYRITIPGELYIPEAEIRLQTLQIISREAAARYNPDQLLNPALLEHELVVRNWRPGDRFWPAHTKSAKKLKELLQDRHVSGPAKKHWPIILSGKQIVWVPGFAVATEFRAVEGAKQAVLIREVAEEGI